MFKVEKVTDEKGQLLIQDPPIARFFFQSTIAVWLWLVVRVYVGYDFVIAGWEKAHTAAWMNGSGQGILRVVEERPWHDSQRSSGHYV